MVFKTPEWVPRMPFGTAEQIVSQMKMPELRVSRDTRFAVH